MNSEGRKLLAVLMLCGVMLLSLVLVSAAETLNRSFLPVLLGGTSSMNEVRALWITRFDWTNSRSADPVKLDEIVANAAAAGFNVLYFQVRAEADAYYQSSVEPWSRRLTGKLGQNPGWDPLAHLIEKARPSGLQVHAYINVYPLWTGCSPPPEDVAPSHLYYLLGQSEGMTDGKLNSAQWDSTESVICEPYLRASPASLAFDNHLRGVVQDLVENYGVDGIHLDHIRYAGADASCDPVSAARYGSACAKTEAYAQWQRQQVDGTVRKLYEQLRSLKPELWLTAAVWPVYRDTYGWGVSSGYDTYYQDAQAWLAGEYIDGVSPMIYSGSPDCNRPYFWSRERWATLVGDYLAARNGRFITPGIGVEYCLEDDAANFAEIVSRIEESRAQATLGHALFSYSALLARGYFDDLAAGPYATPALVPKRPWQP